VLTREECRMVDRIAMEQFHIPGLILMENAGRNCAEHLLSRCRADELTQQAVVILCGPGNNGGDGFVIARHLYNRGLKVKVVLFSPPEKYSGDAVVNLQALSGLQLPVVKFDPGWPMETATEVISKVSDCPASWIVDALLGTGATGDPRPPLDQAIEIANSLDGRRLAIDIPSGLDSDTGQPSQATFRAHITCTFIDRKIGFENPAAAAYLGEVVVVGIGAPPEILSPPGLRA
jgi:NAD(P)H-hydrate epimerase